MTRIQGPPANWSEGAFQAEVIKLARSLGWGTTKSQADAMRAEAAQYGVETPPLDGLVFHPRYSLGSEPGWPDLTLVRRRDRRLIFAELKAEKGVVSPRQREVLDLLREFVVIPDFIHTDEWPRIEVFVWRPSDLPRIVEVLR
jgi:hypothetical protein